MELSAADSGVVGQGDMDMVADRPGVDVYEKNMVGGAV